MNVETKVAAKEDKTDILDLARSSVCDVLYYCENVVKFTRTYLYHATHITTRNDATSGRRCPVLWRCNNAVSRRHGASTQIQYCRSEVQLLGTTSQKHFRKMRS